MKTGVMIVLFLFASVSAAVAGMSYECGRYINGEWQGYTTVTADSREEAERLAYAKFKDDLKVPFDSIKCK